MIYHPQHWKAAVDGRAVKGGVEGVRFSTLLFLEEGENV